MNRLRTLLAIALFFLPAIATAHPGHYHPPGEVDEFDTSAFHAFPSLKSILPATLLLALAACLIRRKSDFPKL